MVTGTVFLAEILIVVLGIVVFIQAPKLIYIFREDEDVVEIGARALRLRILAGMVMPACMATEMLLQSTGQKLEAALVSAMRSGIILIPVLLIMAYVRGLSGIQEAQPLAYVLTFFPSLLFCIWLMRHMPKEE